MSSDDQGEFKYWAFVSYSSRDRKWGEWLRKRLEGYGLPKDFVGLELADGTKLPKNLKPVFRDRDELTGSAELGPAINRALVESRYLIVLCSPNSARSEWVDKEIATFIGMGRQRNVLALIVEGEPNSGDAATECFPPSMRYPVEPLAGDLRREGDGKERGFLKVLAGVAELSFDDLYRRHERAARRRRLLAGMFATVAVAVLAVLTMFAFGQKRLAEKSELEAREARDLAEGRLAASLAEQGRQAFMNEDGVRAAAFLNEARKVDARIPALDRMLGALWESQSGEVLRVRGERIAVASMFFPEAGGELLWSDALGRVRSVSLEGRWLRELGEPISNSAFEQMEALPMRGNRYAAFRQKTNLINPDSLLQELEVADVATGENFGIAWPERFFRPTILVLSPGGDRVLAAGALLGSDESLFLWEVGSDELVPVPLKEDERAKSSQWFFSGDGKHLLQLRGNSEKMDLVARDGKTGAVISSVDLPGKLENYSLVRGREVAVGREHVVIGFRDGRLVSYTLVNDELVPDGPEKMVEGEAMETEEVRVSDDGSLVLHLGKLDNAVLYQREGWKVLWHGKRSDVHGSCRGGAISSDGKWVAVACDTGVLLYDVEAGELSKVGGFGGDGRLTLALSPDGKLLAAGTEGGDLVVRQVETGGDKLIRCGTNGGGNFTDLSEVRPGVFLAHGGEPYLLEAYTGKAEKAGEEFREISAVSPDGNLVVRGQPRWGISILPARGVEGIPPEWNAGEVNLFIEDGKSAGVLVNNKGLFRPYDSTPAYMGAGRQCEEAEGQVTALLREEAGERIMAGFANGVLAITALEGEELAPFMVRKPQDAAENIPTPLAFAQGVVLYAAGGALYLYDVDKDARTEIPVAEFQSARLVPRGGSMLVATVNVFGQVECWDTDGSLVSSGRPVKGVTGEMIYVGMNKQGAKGGTAILLVETRDEILTSFGNRVFMWSWPELDLLWRSADVEIPSMHSDGIVLRKYDPETGRVVFSDRGFGGSGATFDRLMSLPVPADAPGIEEVARYLEGVAAVAISRGQVVPLTRAEP